MLLMTIFVLLSATHDITMCGIIKHSYDQDATRIHRTPHNIYSIVLLIFILKDVTLLQLYKT